ATHVYPEPRVQAPESLALSLGARVKLTGTSGQWAETTAGFVPAGHLRALGDWPDDPVAVAESLIGTPYLWGGNSRAGLDCSGLNQLSLHAAGLACPGDSDQQEAIGADIPEGAALHRGDLIFWKGHVAIIVDPARLIHANGHTMSVAYEGIHACIARIAAQGGGPVIARRRL
ncbi:MAG: C40 family peptidase, partial [Tabrizicola sp.]|nr:C40 family peptidase [Tabrizicola sp.]